MHLLTPFTKAVRRFPKGAPMTDEIMDSNNDFYDFCVEHLWDKLAAEEGMNFDDLSPAEQMDIDFRALMVLCAALNETRDEMLAKAAQN